MGRRKKTDEEKNESKRKKIEDSVIDKDEQLSVFTKTKISSLSQEVIDKFPIKPVRSTSLITGKVKAFNESNYEESLNEAYKWMKDNNAMPESKRKLDWCVVELTNYYPQEFKSKSILVGFVEKGKRKDE